MELTPNMLSQIAEELRTKFLTSDLPSQVLPQEDADRFIDMLVDQSALLKYVDVYRTNYRSGERAMIDLTDPVTQAATENPTTEETGKPTVTTAQYTCNKIKSAFFLTWEDLNWTIERGDFEDTVVRLWNKRMSMDMEMLGLHGDADKYAAPATAYEKLVDIDDGWISWLLDNPGETHVVDVHSGGDPVSIETSIWQKAYNALPDKYKAATANLRWIVAPRIVSDYRYYLASRNTDLGDAMIAGSPTITPVGISILEVPLMPFNLGTGSNETVLLLTDPRNLMFVIHRELRLAREVKVLEDRVWFAGFGYVDFVVLNPDAVVIVKGLKANDAI